MSHKLVTRSRPWIEVFEVDWCMSVDTEEKKVSRKEFIHAFLLSKNNQLLTDGRRLWGIETGWWSPFDILYVIKNVAIDSTGGPDAWKAFSVEEVSWLIILTGIDLR